MESFKDEELVLIRCIIIREKKLFFKAKDYQGNIYLIRKNEYFSKVKKGEDRTFYAYKKTTGLFPKKVVLYPISFENYIKNNNRETTVKTLNDLGMDLKDLNKYEQLDFS